MARRGGLGKGLGALIPTEVVSDAGSELREVPLSSIRPSVVQPRTRFDEESMAALAASIRELGVLQPVLVRQIDGEGESYELIAGERRWRAARRAGLQTIPVLVRSGTSDVDSLEQALVENLHRADLNPLEEAAAYQQLIDEFGLTHDQVATKVGKGRATITNALRLLHLPAGAQRALAEGTISAGHARALLGTPDRTLQEALVARIVTENLSVRAVEDIVRTSGVNVDEDAAPANVVGITQGTTTPVSPRRRLPEPGILELEELLSTHLDTRVKVDLQNRRGRLVIEFATLEDLERIYRVMVGEHRPRPAEPATSAAPATSGREHGL
ncbi:MAG TPA: ParB/RepB/Spo0J family partition protein [Acidimicrobiales bacterium]|nr:ParB/RepB/Spo0J family partition protein [Acidimicrobiales bacterium]